MWAGIARGNRRRKSREEKPGGKGGRDRKKNRGRENAGGRKCWSINANRRGKSQEEIAGGNHRNNRKKNRGKIALEKIARRKCWRKMREGIAGGNREKKSLE